MDEARVRAALPLARDIEDGIAALMVLIAALPAEHRPALQFTAAAVADTAHRLHDALADALREG